MADRYLLESGSPDGYLLEDGSGVLILEFSLSSGNRKKNISTKGTTSFSSSTIKLSKTG